MTMRHFFVATIKSDQSFVLLEYSSKMSFSLYTICPILILIALLIVKNVPHLCRFSWYTVMITSIYFFFSACLMSVASFFRQWYHVFFYYQSHHYVTSTTVQKEIIMNYYFLILSLSCSFFCLSTPFSFFYSSNGRIDEQ